MTNERGKRGGRMGSKVARGGAKGGPASRRDNDSVDRTQDQSQQVDRVSTRRAQGSIRMSERLRSASARDGSSKSVGVKEGEDRETAEAKTTSDVYAADSGRSQIRRHNIATRSSASAVRSSASAEDTSRVRKKPEAREARVLWSPGNKRGRESRPPSAGDRGESNDESVSSAGRPSLLSLARSFKDTFGEDVENDADQRHAVNEEDSQTYSKRTRSHGMGRALQVAAAMPPEKLAVAVKNAKARAREERLREESHQRQSKADAQIVYSDTGESCGGRERDASIIDKNPKNQASKVTSGDAASANVARAAVSTRSTPATPIDSAHISSIDHMVGTTSGVEGGDVGSGIASGVDGSQLHVDALPRNTPGFVPPLSQALVLAITPSYQSPPESQDPPPNSCEEELPSEKTIPPDDSVRGVGEGECSSVSTRPPSSKVIVHTLRLRPRSHVQDSDGRALEDGVEEWKGFEPPNLVGDTGVEESKGFHPPNVLPTSHNKQCLPLTSATVSTDTVRLRASCESPRATPLKRNAPSPPSPGVKSWGPTFSVTPYVTTLVGPTSGSIAVSNPWVFSQDASTFARNRGRPLAGCFPSPGMGTRLDGNETTQEGLAREPKRAKIVHSGSGSSSDQGVRTGGDTHRAHVATSDSSHASQSDGAQANHNALVPTTEPAAGITSDDHVLNSLGEDDLAAVCGVINEPLDAEEMASDGRITESAYDLLERMKQEREESIELDRKLTQALLDP